MEEEGLGAALQSVVASPSGASWAGGQLAAFPGGSEPSAGLWPRREGGNKKGKDLQDETPHSTTIPPSSPFLPNIPTHPAPSLRGAGLAQILLPTSFPISTNLGCQPLSPSHGGLPTWYLWWPQTPQDSVHQLGLVSDAWLLAVSLSESLRPEAFHWQRRGLLPSGKEWGSTMREETPRHLSDTKAHPTWPTPVCQLTVS